MNTNSNLQSLNFTLTVEEANLVLKALGDLPYAEVSSLIGNIHTQANAQLAALQQGGTAAEAASTESPEEVPAMNN